MNYLQLKLAQMRAGGQGVELRVGGPAGGGTRSIEERRKEDRPERRGRRGRHLQNRASLRRAERPPDRAAPAAARGRRRFLLLSILHQRPTTQQSSRRSRIRSVDGACAAAARRV